MSTQLDLEFLSLPEAREIRDEAIATVAENAERWIDSAVSELRSTIRGYPDEFLAEEIRRRLLPVVGRPHSPNAWGAFTTRIMKEGLTHPTGEWRAAQAKASHARRMPVYAKGPR